MEDVDRTQRRSVKLRSHMPKDSVFYERIVPILLVVMGILTSGLILFAAGVLFGIIRF